MLEEGEQSDRRGVPVVQECKLPLPSRLARRLPLYLEWFLLIWGAFGFLLFSFCFSCMCAPFFVLFCCIE